MSSSGRPRAGRAILALTISYDGADFVGSQRQGEQRSVQGALEQALGELFQSEVRTVFAGRTDRGVHAAGQVVSLKDENPRLSGEQIRDAVNARLDDDLAVVAVERRPWGFHARWDARWREYRYRLWAGPKQPLARATVVRRVKRLDVAAMNDGAARLVGEHDLASFTGDGEGVPWSERHTTRTIYVCGVRTLEPWWTGGEGQLLELRVVGDGFLPKMVRTIAGALIEVGSGKRRPDWIDELIAGRDRRLAGMTAPAHGLTLWRIGYEGDEP